MRLRTRFVLIAAGVVIFLAIAPAMVLFATGFRYDFENNQLLKTGTISIRTEPRQAVVSIDGERQDDTTPYTKRFVVPGEYAVEISRAGFRPWEKNITVSEGRVSYLPDQDRDKIYLFQQTLIQTSLATGTADFLLNGDFIYYISKSDFFRIRPGGDGRTLLMSASTTLQNPKILDITAADARNPRFILEDTSKSYYIDQSQTAELPAGLRDFRFLEENKILALNSQNELVTFTPGLPAVSVLASDVLAFLPAENIYYVVPGNSANLELWSMRRNNAAGMLRDDLPRADEIRIVLSENNQIFLLLDGALYLVSDSLKKLNDGMDYAYWDNAADTLVYGNEHEIWLYQPSQTPRSHLITRTAKNLGIGSYNKTVGYIFVGEERELKAIEFDQSGQPNVYTFDETENPIAKVIPDPNAARLIYLDGNNLYSLKIR